MKSLILKNTSDEDINKILKLSDNEFEGKITSLFIEQRTKRKEYLDENQLSEIEKNILIQTLDMNWRSHLQYLEHLRQVVGLRRYGQKDPLIEYKKESFSLFESLLEKIKIDAITILFNLVVAEKPLNQKENNQDKKIKIAGNPDCLLSIKKNEKISRNERCPATGKKFKQCCGSL